MSSWHSLPDEIWVHVAAFLPTVLDVAHLRHVSSLLLRNISLFAWLTVGPDKLEERVPKVCVLYATLCSCRRYPRAILQLFDSPSLPTNQYAMSIAAARPPSVRQCYLLLAMHLVREIIGCLVNVPAAVFVDAEPTARYSSMEAYAMRPLTVNVAARSFTYRSVAFTYADIWQNMAFMRNVVHLFRIPESLLQEAILELVRAGYPRSDEVVIFFDDFFPAGSKALLVAYQQAISTKPGDHSFRANIDPKTIRRLRIMYSPALDNSRDMLLTHYYARHLRLPPPTCQSLSVRAWNEQTSVDLCIYGALQRTLFSVPHHRLLCLTDLMFNETFETFAAVFRVCDRRLQLRFGLLLAKRRWAPEESLSSVIQCCALAVRTLTRLGGQFRTAVTDILRHAHYWFRHPPVLTKANPSQLLHPKLAFTPICEALRQVFTVSFRSFLTRKEREVVFYFQNYETDFDALLAINLYADSESWRRRVLSHIQTTETPIAQRYVSKLFKRLEQSDDEYMDNLVVRELFLGVHRHAYAEYPAETFNTARRIVFRRPCLFNDPSILSILHTQRHISFFEPSFPLELSDFFTYETLYPSDPAETLKCIFCAYCRCFTNNRPLSLGLQRMLRLCQRAMRVILCDDTYTEADADADAASASTYSYLVDLDRPACCLATLTYAELCAMRLPVSAESHYCLSFIATSSFRYADNKKWRKLAYKLLVPYMPTWFQSPYPEVCLYIRVCRHAGMSMLVTLTTALNQCGYLSVDIEAFCRYMLPGDVARFLLVCMNTYNNRFHMPIVDEIIRWIPRTLEAVRDVVDVLQGVSLVDTRFFPSYLYVSTVFLVPLLCRTHEPFAYAQTHNSAGVVARRLIHTFDPGD